MITSLFGAQVGLTERTAELLTGLAGQDSVVVEHDMAFVRSIARTVSEFEQGLIQQYLRV